MAFKTFRRFLWLRRQNYYDGNLLRLEKVTRLSTSPLGFEFLVRPVRYEAVCRTHLCLDAQERPNAETLRQTVHPNGALSPLESSRLANALGINFVLFTADGRVVLPRRSGRVAVRPHELSPSFSGDCEWTDAPATGNSFALRHLLREALEELNVEEADVAPDNVRLLGLGRELIRGGKPELFLSARTRLTMDDFLRRHRGAPDAWEFRKRGGGWVFWDFGSGAASDGPVGNHHGFLEAFHRLIDAHGPEMSAPLCANIALWAATRLPDGWLGRGF